jgi:hypothetical protein
MKCLSLFCFLFLCLNSCKKKEKIVENTAKSATAKVQKDSLSIENLKIEPLKVSADIGKTAFSQNKKTMFYFDAQSNTGEIKISGKSYTLDMMNFTDNEYHISGNGVKITATEGDFKEMTSDCLYGNFPEIKVELNNQQVILKNISVQDCPAY